MNKKHIQQLKKLAYYQITGGVIGLAIVGYTLIAAEKINEILLAIGVACVFYAFSIISGYRLLNKPNQGLTLSLLNQILQSISVLIGSYGFKFVAGIGVTAGINLLDDFKLSFNFDLSTLQFYLNAPTDSIQVGINLVAFYLIYFITRLKDKRKEQELLQITISE